MDHSNLKFRSTRPTPEQRAQQNATPLFLEITALKKIVCDKQRELSRALRRAAAWKKAAKKYRRDLKSAFEIAGYWQGMHRELTALLVQRNAHIDELRKRIRELEKEPPPCL